MRRSSISKTLAGLVLALFALEAISQSKDDALASISNTGDEPSGWMRLEVAIFVDTSDSALDSEFWEIEPKLGYPANRRWLTDSAEIKALMDQWGESSVSIDANGAIVIAPEPPPKPDPAPTLKLTQTPQEDTEVLWDSSQAIPIGSTTLVSASFNNIGQSSQDSNDLGYLEQASSGLIQQEPIAESGFPNTGVETLGTAASGTSGYQSADQTRLPLVSNGLTGNEPIEIEFSKSISEVNEQTSDGAEKIPLESHQASRPDSEESFGTLAIDALEADIDRMHTSVIGNVLRVKPPGDESALGDALKRQSTEVLEGSEKIPATDNLASQDPAETGRESDNFFAIEGLGENFSGLAGGSDMPSGLADDRPGTELINWLPDNEGQEATESAPLMVEPTPPPLPASYQAMSIEMLAPGLKKLEKETGKRPISVLSWLQPMNGDRDAVVVDSWSDEGDFPKLQGTVEISPAKNETDGFQLSTRVWANTTAHYLPARLPAMAIPAAPTRVLVIEPQSTPSEAAEVPSVEFIDMSTGVTTATSLSSQPQDPTDMNSKKRVIAPLKHAIALNETRDLREGYVRYIDHPVIQVAAVWRELKYSELYELGEAQRVRKDIDSLTRSLVTQQSTKPRLNAEQQPPPLNQ